MRRVRAIAYIRGICRLCCQINVTTSLPRRHKVGPLSGTRPTRLACMIASTGLSLSHTHTHIGRVEMQAQPWLNGKMSAATCCTQFLISRYIIIPIPPVPQILER